MANATPYFAILSLTVTDTVWSPIIPAINCNTFSVRPSGDTYIRTDAADASTEDMIAAGIQDVAILSRSATSTNRFTAGAPIAYLKAVSGSTTVKIQFLS